MGVMSRNKYNNSDKTTAVVECTQNTTNNPTNTPDSKKHNRCKSLLKKVQDCFKENKFYSILVCLSIVTSGIIAFLGIYPHFNDDFLNKSINITRNLKNIFLASSGMISTICVVSGLLSKFKKKDDKNFLSIKNVVSKISPILLAILIFYAPLPVISSYACMSNLENYKVNNSLSGTSNNDPNIEAVTPILFNVDYNDPLFSTYDNAQLEENKDVLIGSIKDSLLKENKMINNDSNKSIFNEKISEVYDYEKDYLLIVENGLYLNNTDERINHIDDALNKRLDADENYKSSKNQRLIGERYREKASEYFRLGDTNEAVKLYEKSIYWFLTSINTYYNETEQDKTELKRMKKGVILSIEEILNIENQNTEKHKKAELFRKVYSEVFTKL